MRLQDLTGQRFGRLVAIERATNRRKTTRWLCLCECGVQKVFQAGNLKSGATTSCGCFQVEMTVIRSTVHGKSPRKKISPEYRTWKGIIQRTTNVNNSRYSDYGERGIGVCERWLVGFENFLEDMGFKPSPSHSIERRNNNLGYSHGNCYWATATEQNRNTRRNVMVTYEGETRCVSEWAHIKGMSSSTLEYRLKNPRFTLAEALETPVGCLRK